MFKVKFASGLPSHVQHALAKRLATGFGGMVSFKVKGTKQTAIKFVTNLKVIPIIYGKIYLY